MYTFVLLALAVAAAVASGPEGHGEHHEPHSAHHAEHAVHHAAPVHHPAPVHHAAPAAIHHAPAVPDYSDYYTTYAQEQSKTALFNLDIFEDTFVSRFITSIDAFFKPLSLIDYSILGLGLAGGILILNNFGIISFTTITDFVDSIFNPANAGNRMARVLLGDKLDDISEIVHNAIENVEKWNKL